MADSPRKLAERWFDEVWNQGRRETIDELLAPDCIIHDANQEIAGPSGFKAFYDNIHSLFSEVRVDPELSIGDGDYVLVRWVSTGKHRATGRNVKITGMSLMRFHNGHAVEAWQNWDRHGMMQQIEAAPKAMAAEARWPASACWVIPPGRPNSAIALADVSSRPPYAVPPVYCP